ncbi:type III secretion system stator protein SctL [Variovorax paradoxus]|uniref:Flagellar assembly protein FliH n=1 Tax=Variovorax paradoxus (strain EPS) TaxID=595537 RepID=E6V255_VARPE|nr:type III secretion system stator protein SctL [Variovorax paradoxus]ADU39134.1 type III secretion apparatus protein, HrpE/YscL family [Variovorax paradoxus EPS]
MGLAFLITTDNLQLLSERKVLKENEYAALLEASEVVETARAEAGRMVEQAELTAEASRREGYDEGLRQAKAEYTKQMLSDAMAVERQLHALRTSMAQIVVKAVGQFLVESDPATLFRSALMRVETLLRAESFITVRVAPAQEAKMRETLHRLRTDSKWTTNVSIIPDADLAAGACTVQTSTGVLEIGVDAQLEAFRRAVETGGVAPPFGGAR